MLKHSGISRHRQPNTTFSIEHGELSVQRNIGYGQGDAWGRSEAEWWPGDGESERILSLSSQQVFKREEQKVFSLSTDMTGDLGKVGFLFIYLTDKLKKCWVMENISKANARNQRKWLIYKRCVRIIHHILGGRGPFCHAYIQRDIDNWNYHILQLQQCQISVF